MDDERPPHHPCRIGNLPPEGSNDPPTTCRRQSQTHQGDEKVPMELQGVVPAEPLVSPMDARGVSSLDPTETSENETPVQAFLKEAASPTVHEQGLWDTSAIRFRHGGWKIIRERVHASLIRTGQSSSRISAFCSCGAGSWIQRRPLAIGNGWEYRIRASCCHDRLCTPCANTRSWRLQLALQSVMKGKRMSFITLTLAGKDESLGEKIDRLYKHFKALRSHPLWDERVRGGAAFLEIKWSDKANRWHPHLHVMADANYIDQGELSTVWRTITKDSYIVDIRRVQDDKQAAAYVTKYASKPLNTSFSNSPVLLDEAVIALKGRRLALAFGDWYGTPLDLESDSLLDEGEEGGSSWENFVPLETLLDEANSGDNEARDMLIRMRAEAQWRMSLDTS